MDTGCSPGHPAERQPRERLAGLLWGDRGDAQTRDSLKNALARVRAALDGAGPAALEADRHAVRWVERLRRAGLPE